MRAAVLDRFGGDVRLRDVPCPDPGLGQVRVRVAGCGVGLTLERARTGSLGGSAPRTVGHEFAGTVDAVGPGVTRWSEGDRVTTSFYLTCGECRMCVSGRETLCSEFGGFVGCHIDGGLAEYAVVPARNLVTVPAAVPLAEAGIVADAIATPFHVMNQRARVVPGTRVAVIGAGGGVGVHMVAMARAFGGEVVAVERDPAKAESLQALDVACTVVPRGENWARQFTDEVGGPVDVCIDMVASANTLSQGLGVVGRGGTFVVVGFQDGTTLSVDPKVLLLEEVWVTGSRYATRSEIAASLDLVARHDVAITIGARFELRDTPRAYRAMQENDAFGRILVEVEG
jgi:D-arabinose 1-dehydrogenase-like Zn-dependent alcohol dehydrogenase